MISNERQVLLAVGRLDFNWNPRGSLGDLDDCPFAPRTPSVGFVEKSNKKRADWMAISPDCLSY